MKQETNVIKGGSELDCLNGKKWNSCALHDERSHHIIFMVFMTFLEMTIKKIQIDHWRRQRVINCTPTTNYNPRDVYEPYTFYTETSQGLYYKNKVT